jgi:(R,R)-butanediol dehydrogenase / meso-butanediol dehydrogenase / diacetyl reductase
MAERLGVEVFDPTTTHLDEALRGRTLDLALECAGVGSVITDAAAALGPRGHLVLLGMHEKPMSFEPISLMYREVSMTGSSTYTDDDFRAVIAAMADGGFSPDGWVETRPLDDLLATFDALRSGGPSKVLIDLHA